MSSSGRRRRPISTLSLSFGTMALCVAGLMTFFLVDPLSSPSGESLVLYPATNSVDVEQATDSTATAEQSVPDGALPFSDEEPTAIAILLASLAVAGFSFGVALSQSSEIPQFEEREA